MLGFNYRGHHSSEYGIVFQTKSRPIVPPLKTVFNEDVQDIDGSLDFTEADGRAYYSDKVLEIDIKIREKSSYDLHKKIASVVAWLQGSWDDLIFDDMPNVKWICRPVNMGSIAPTLAQYGISTIQFRCKSFNNLLFDSSGISLEDNIVLDSNYELNSGIENTISISSGTNNITVSNYGDAPTRPIINLSGSFSSVTIKNMTDSDNVTTLTFPNSFTALSIDCEKQICTINGTDVTQNCTGEFLELSTGDNSIVIICSGSGTASFVFDYNYFYSDWSLS